MTYKESFLRFMVDCGVLTFGEFTLKSGRKAPYFINAGNYHSGAQLMELGRYYAACIAEHNIPVETVFGPAYKGIPLAAAAAVALADKYQKDVNFCFDRKEVKDHGEGGMFVGKKLTDGEKVVIIEDVMTSGKAMAEVYPKLKGAADVDITGMVIVCDTVAGGIPDFHLPQEKRPFQPPFLAHSWHGCAPFCRFRWCGGIGGNSVSSRYHFRGFSAL